MIDVTHKSTTLRQAIATAIVKVSKKETIEAVKNKTVPKSKNSPEKRTRFLFILIIVFKQFQKIFSLFLW